MTTSIAQSMPHAARSPTERFMHALGPHVRHVIWDFNGTLLDDVDLCVDLINRMLEDEGLSPLSTEAYKRVFDFPVRDYYVRLGFDLSGDRFEELAVRWLADYEREAPGCALQPEAPELLTQLKSRGVHNYVLSASLTRTIVSLLDHHQIIREFREIVGRDDHYAHGKEELGLELKARHGLDPETTVLIGDTTHDHAVAEALGVRCILVANGHHPEERLKALGCTVVQSLKELG